MSTQPRQFARVLGSENAGQACQLEHGSKRPVYPFFESNGDRRRERYDGMLRVLLISPMTSVHLALLPGET